MADDPNKSKSGRVPNTVGGSDPFADVIGGFPSQSKTLEQIRAEQRLATSSSYIQEQFAKVGRGEMPLAQANELASRVSPYVNSLERSINQMEEVRALKGEREYGRIVSSAVNVGASSSRINAYGADPNIIGEGMRRSGSLSYDDVYGQRNEFKQRADSLRSRMMEEAQSSSPNRVELAKLGGQLSYAERGMAVSSVAMRDQARRGVDPTGQYRGIEDTMSTISGRERSAAANQTVAGGIDWKAFQAELKATADSLKQLNKEFQEGTKTEKEYREEAAKLSAQYSRGLDVESAGKATGQNVSGKGFLEKLKDNMTGAAWFGAAGDVLKQTARIVNYVGVQAQEQKYDLATGFAGIANRQFEDQRAGLGGNMAAFRRAFGGTYGRAAEVGGGRGLAAGTAQALNAAGDASIAVGNTMSSATSGDVGGAIGTGAGGVADAAIAGTDMAMGLTRSQARLRGTQQSITLEDANAHVDDASAQRAFDTITGINRATRGAGGRRSAMVGSIASSKMVSQMADAMISQEQMAVLTGQGVQQLGGAMTASVLSGAGRAQKSGLMGASDYISNIATMAGAGGGSRELEAIMKSAVAAGMDNSKNIQQMVAATADLAGRSAGMGINSSTGAASVIAKGVQGLASLPENMRAAAAASAANYATDVSRDKSLDLSSVTQWAGLGKAFPNSTLGERTGLARMTPAEIAQLRSGDKSVAINKGLDKILLKNGEVDKGALDAVERENRLKIINKVTSFGMAAPNDSTRKELQEFGETGKGLKEGTEGFRFLMQSADVSDISGLGLRAELGAGGPRQKRIGARGQTEADEADRAKEKAESAVFTKGLANFGGKFGEFAKKMSDLAEHWPIDAGAAKQMSESFHSFDVSTRNFDGAVNKLTTFLDRKTGGWSSGGRSPSNTQKAGTGQNQTGN